MNALLLLYISACQVVYEIPSPGPTARLEMLKYHGRNKPVEDDNLYYKVAEVTAGWSAAALANLMNEAAILTVCVWLPRMMLFEVSMLALEGCRAAGKANGNLGVHALPAHCIMPCCTSQHNRLGVLD